MKKYKYSICLMISLILCVGMFWSLHKIENENTLKAMYKDDWAIYNYGQKVEYKGRKGIDINVLPAWDITQGKKEVLVAVVDTGVDITCNSFEIINMLEGWDFYNDDATTYDEFIHDYHGTYISTTIAKVAPRISLLPIKFMEGTSGTIEDAILGINFAISKGAKIINCSWNFNDYNEKLYNIMKDNPEVLFVCAAGNHSVDIDKFPIYPCSYRLNNIINVLAVDSEGNLLPTSGYGKNTVDVAAPGDNIKVVLPENEEAFIDGTSVSTAYVSATAALLLSVNDQLKATELKQIIISSAQEIEAISEKCVAGGIVDIDSAIKY